MMAICHWRIWYCKPDCFPIRHDRDGLNQGMQPIAGYNFGAQQYHRVNQVLKLTIYGATTVTTTGFLVGELMPELAVSAFTTHED